MKYALLIAMMILGLTACKEEKASSGVDASRQLSIVTYDGTRHDYLVELAVTPEQQQKGLMNRTSMPENEGMLFMFEGEAERSFWMKNTLIPLDLIFIKKDGTVMHIHENSVPQDLTSMKSHGPAAAVLELNAGQVAKMNLFEDDKVHHLFFGNSLAGK